MKSAMTGGLSEGRPLLALTPGDCTGIGPEITAKVLADPALREELRLLVIGDQRVLRRGAEIAGLDLPLTLISGPDDADYDSASVQMIDLQNCDPADFPAGQVSARSGFLTGETLAQAVAFGKDRVVDGVSFAPLNKRAMFDGGWEFADEHKMFAHLLQHQGYFSEMNVLEGQWMSRVTSHVSLRQALDMIDETSISDAIILVDRMMRRAGIARPRIAVAALNPHAGENGLFGRDEIELIGPVVRKMAGQGYDCSGPWPADSIYIRAFEGEFDSVVAMYHDQGQIATKLRGFNKGVTVTAGLDVIFTTPAHGTAFDITGQGKARPDALTTALRLGAQLAKGKAAADKAA